MESIHKYLVFIMCVCVCASGRQAVGAHTSHELLSSQLSFYIRLSTRALRHQYRETCKIVEDVRYSHSMKSSGFSLFEHFRCRVMCIESHRMAARHCRDRRCRSRHSAPFIPFSLLNRLNLGIDRRIM